MTTPRRRPRKRLDRADLWRPRRKLSPAFLSAGHLETGPYPWKLRLYARPVGLVMHDLLELMDDLVASTG